MGQTIPFLIIASNVFLQPDNNLYIVSDFTTVVLHVNDGTFVLYNFGNERRKKEEEKNENRLRGMHQTRKIVRQIGGFIFKLILPNFSFVLFIFLSRTHSAFISFFNRASMMRLSPWPPSSSKQKNAIM